MKRWILTTLWICIWLRACNHSRRRKINCFQTKSTYNSINTTIYKHIEEEKSKCWISVDSFIPLYHPQNICYRIINIINSINFITLYLCHSSTLDISLTCFQKHLRKWKLCLLFLPHSLRVKFFAGLLLASPNSHPLAYHEAFVVCCLEWQISPILPL